MPRGRGSLGVIFPIDDALHNIAFEIHAKELNRSTCCLICWLWVGPRYHVLDGGPDPPRGRGNFGGGNVTVPCKIMGHLTLSCATTAEPIDMSFWMKTRVGTCYIWCRSSTGRGQFSVVVVTPDLSGPFKSIGNVRCSWRHICGKRDHSVANNIMQQNGLFIISVVTVWKCFMSVGFGRFCRKNLGFRFGLGFHDKCVVSFFMSRVIWHDFHHH